MSDDEHKHSDSSSSSSSSGSTSGKKLRGGKWKGWFKDERDVDEEHESGDKWDIEFTLKFHKSGAFKGKGEDDVGKFVFENGVIDDDKKVIFLKRYETHTVSYEGEVCEDGSVKGGWFLTNAPDVKGKFKIWNAAD